MGEVKGIVEIEYFIDLISVKKVKMIQIQLEKEMYSERRCEWIKYA